MPAPGRAPFDADAGTGHDTGMERFARLAARLVGAPVALVSLLDGERRTFPGVVGLDGDFAAALPHSPAFSDRPLVLSDARGDDRTCLGTAFGDLGLAAYAGMPLTDADGQVLGVLCAIDCVPRHWTEQERRDLEDLAAACGTELRLRVVSSRADQARGEAQSYTRQVRTSLEHAELLLRAAEDLADTTGIEEVRRGVRDLVTSDLKPTKVGLVLLEAGRMRPVAAEDCADDADDRAYERFLLTSGWPTARAARGNAMITVGSPAELRASYGEEAASAFTALGLHTAVSVPLPGTREVIGALTLAWDVPHTMGVTERAVLTAIAGYTARAVERALFVDNRIDAARLMQQAMITDLPTTDGLQVAARYLPAAQADMVGGDWFDTYRLPPTGGDDLSAPATLAITVGDITGHDLHAATVMGQVRSMLRQADLDHPDQGPARAVTAFERANKALDIGASGTLVHAHLRPAADSWEIIWTNAGHPPPILSVPGARAEQLTEHGALIHPSLPTRPRTQHRHPLLPGATVLLYTDGLVEHRGQDVGAAIDRTAALLARGADQELPALLAAIADQVAGPAPADDVALLAVRIPEDHAGHPGR